MAIVSYSPIDFIFDVNKIVEKKGFNKDCDDMCKDNSLNGCRDLSCDFRKPSSQFQDLLKRRWDEAMEKGMFKFELTESSLYTRIIPGRQGYVAQFNPKRFAERRRPQQIEHVRLPFEGKRFNFNKIHEDEILFRFQPENNPDETDNIVIINNSPLEYGHVLMVPKVKDCLNQVLTEHCIKRAIELSLLVPDNAFKMGYNSLMALASVNHLHVHGWFLREEMPCQRWDATKLFDDVFVLKEGVFPGFGFQVLSESDIVPVSNTIFRMSQYFTENEIPHNFLMTRGESFNKAGRNCVRIFLWPRKPVEVHNKAQTLFNTANAELGGHLPCTNLQGVKDLTEEKAEILLKESALKDDEFKQIVNDLIIILKNRVGLH